MNDESQCEETQQSAQASSGSEETDFSFPQEEGHRKKSTDGDEVEKIEERPLTFYLPSCHCLEEQQKQHSTIETTRVLREKEETNLLAPDHPALERFQKALKDQLQRQLEHLQDEIYEFDRETKEKNALREQMGVEAYEYQQIVCRQQRILEDHIRSLKIATEARQQLEMELKEHKNKYKSETDYLLQMEKEDKELRNEVESINLLLFQTASWEEGVESDITTNKRITEKVRKDQMKLMSDKHKQDIVLYRLQTEVWRLDTELEDIEMKMRVKEREREEIAQAVAEGTTTIEALEAEYRCLMHSWNSVLIAICNRDKVLNCVFEELKKYEESHKNLICEIEKVRKLTKLDMLLNEKLTSVKKKTMYDLTRCKNKTDDELAKQKKIEKQISTCQAIIYQTEADIARVIDENNAEELKLNTLQREIDKRNVHTGEWEEKIFLILEEETTNSKASQHLTLRLRQMKALNRKLEISIALTENKNSVVNTKIESQITINTELHNLLKDMETEKLTLEKQLTTFQDNLKEFNSLIGRRQRHIDKLNSKVFENVIIIGGKEISPTELKIKHLEKNIDEYKEKIREKQMFWMREQRNVLNLSETRQEQISSYDLLRKQILILQQKNLKLSDEIEAIKKQDQKSSRNISNLHNKIAMKSDFLYRRQGEKKNLDWSNDLAQAQFVAKLKETEMQCLRLEAQIADIEEEKVIISKQLLDMSREVMEWEKKLSIVSDTKNLIKQERGAEGELGQMKLEIHKMEVRYSQLKKAQERLITDLEHSVSRREAIVAGSEAREKRSKFGFEKTRINFKRRMDDVKNKIKQLENETQQVKNKIKKVADDKMLKGSQMNDVKLEVDEVKKHLQNVLDEYESIKTNKLMQFELLITKQKKLNMYSDLARGKKPLLLYKTECALMREYNRNEDLNNNLLVVVDNLLTHFPHYMQQLNRVMNTLNLPKLYATDSREWICHDIRYEPLI